MRHKNLLKIKYEGLNWEWFQNQVLLLGVTIYNLDRKDYKNITFHLSSKDYKTITKCEKLKNCKLQIIEWSGFQKLKHHFISRLGVCIGILVMIISIISISRITLSFNIYGLENMEKGIVENKLYEFGIRKGKTNNFQNEELEKYLLSSIPNISMVSVMKKGNAICINIKEKKDKIDEIFENLTTPYNIVIKSINVVSGTALYKEGDVVSAGKPIVGAYTIIDGRKTNCKVVATIEAQAWWTNSLKFETKKVVQQRTGKKLSSTQVLWNDKVILGSEKQPKFSMYEFVEENSNITCNFLPLRINRKTYYETKEIEVLQNFEESKDILLHESRLMAYNKVPTYINITNEEQKIISQNDFIYVNTYLTADVEIKNVDYQ